MDRSENGQTVSCTSVILVPDDARLSSLRTGPPRSRRAFRRTLLHRRHDHRDLLQAHLPGAVPEVVERALLSVGRSSSGTRISTVPALPSRSVAWYSRMAGRVLNGFTRAEADRRKRTRWRRSGHAGRTTGHRLATPAEAFSEVPGRDASRRRPNTAGTFCEEADR